jgi:cobaltochelatase CobN
MAGYAPGKGAIPFHALRDETATGLPIVPVIFYRSALLAADTAPIDGLCEALAARGLTPAPLFVPSLKDKEAATFVREALAMLAPAVIVTTTAFAAGDGETSPFDGIDAPVLQAVIATTRREAWAIRSGHAYRAARTRWPRAGWRARLQGRRTERRRARLHRLCQPARAGPH